MADTPNHGYNVPDQGDEDWHQPLNENFEAYDTDIEIRDQESNLGDYDPKAGAKFLATDTEAMYVGDGSNWNELETAGKNQSLANLFIGGSLEADKIETGTSPLLVHVGPVSGGGEAQSIAMGHPENGGIAVGATISGGGHDGEGNIAGGVFPTIGGGRNQSAGGNYTTIGGGRDNEILGAPYATVGGGEGNTAGADYTTICGGLNNTIDEGREAVIAGGSNNESGGTLNFIGGGADNTANGLGVVISGGYNNTAASLQSFYSAIAGGRDNTSYGQYGAIGGGKDNQTGVDNDDRSPGYSTVVGGENNTASAHHATVAGGQDNEASGTHSFAAGRNAKAEADGSFAWSSGTNSSVRALNENEFVAEAAGGFKLFSVSAGKTGVELASGSGSWSSLSTRTAKSNLDPVDGPDVLDRVDELDISTWNYDDQDDDVRHMGPMAEEFHEEFGLGTDEKHISTVDADGVALAAIQGLSAKLDEKDERIDDQQAQIDDLEAENAELRERLSAVEDRLDGPETATVTPADD